MTTTLVTWLFVLVPVFSTIAWVPQILRLIHSPRLGIGLSVSTWGMWTFTGTVSLLYAIVVVQNNLLILTYAVNALGSAIVLVYAVTARILIRRDQEYAESKINDSAGITITQIASHK